MLFPDADMGDALKDIPVLFVDCQTTGRQPASSHLLELGWAVGSAASFQEEPSGLITRVIALPEQETLSPQILKITGIDPTLLQEAPTEAQVWQELEDTLSSNDLAVTVAHYARFERSFLAPLEAKYGGRLPQNWVCTQELARKLFPGVPSTGLRAMSGFFGAPLPEAHRAEMHLRATLRIWHHLVKKLEADKGIVSLDQLMDWLAATPARRSEKRTFLVDRNARLTLPERPGIYRMLAANGAILYVGKATSLRSRVNSYFRHRAVGRLNEWLTQVQRIEHTETQTAVEAALLETDLIKTLNPPYNVSLRNRQLQLHNFDALDEVRLALGTGVWGDQLFAALKDPAVFEQGARRLFPDYPKERERWLDRAALLRLGFRFLSQTEAEPEEEAEPSCDEWTVDRVERRLRRTLEHTALRAWRTHWLIRLSEASVAWRPRKKGPWRLLVVEGGAITQREWIRGKTLPTPPGWRKSKLERAASFDVATLDRLRVLTTELRRIVAEGGELRGRLSPNREFRRVGPRTRMA